MEVDIENRGNTCEFAYLTTTTTSRKHQHIPIVTRGFLFQTIVFRVFVGFREYTPFELQELLFLTTKKGLKTCMLYLKSILRHVPCHQLSILQMLRNLGIKYVVFCWYLFISLKWISKVHVPQGWTLLSWNCWMLCLWNGCGTCQRAFWFSVQYISLVSRMCPGTPSTDWGERWAGLNHNFEQTWLLLSSHNHGSKGKIGPSNRSFLSSCPLPWSWEEG